MSQRALGRQFTDVWHAAPASAAESIDKHGLDGASGEKQFPMDYPRGTYVFTKPEAAHNYASMREREDADEYGPEGQSFHVYRASVPTSHLAPDPLAADDPNPVAKHARRVTQPIPPERVQRVSE